ncbi:MAG: hypothetical protein Q9188_007468 [Gyalolechia gomerana]
MAWSDPNSNQRLRVPSLHKSKASHIPLPASPSSTLPSHTISLWRNENGVMNVPELGGRTRPRYPKRHSSPNRQICPQPPVEYPLTPELKTKVQIQLKKQYHAAKRRTHCRDIKDHWQTETGIFKLEGAAAPPQAIHHWNIARFCNKPTTFYWSEAAQRQGQCPGFIFGAVYKAWFRYHNNYPNLDHKHFFANLVQITATGPNTIDGIVKAHRLLNSQLASFMTKMRQESKDGTCPVNCESLPHYHLLGLSRAIIVIYDEFLEPEVALEPRIRIFLDREARRQHVLLVLTGDDHDLSAPISFDTIKSESLPLAHEVISEELKPYDIIRVPLIVAIQFILDLQQREAVATSRTAGKAADRSAKLVNDDASLDAADRDAAEWADNLIRYAAHDIGGQVEREPMTDSYRDALEAIEAQERGEEPVPRLDDEILDPRWE